MTTDRANSYTAELTDLLCEMAEGWLPDVGKIYTITMTEFQREKLLEIVVAASLKQSPGPNSEDSKRLEWLIADSGLKVVGSAARGWSVCDCNDGLVFLSRSLPTFRDAIDAAISARDATGGGP